MAHNMYGTPIYTREVPIVVQPVVPPVAPAPIVPPIDWNRIVGFGVVLLTLFVIFWVISAAIRAGSRA